MPKRTPWGDADYEKEYTNGVVFYGTPGHGGFKVDAKVRKTWPQVLQDFVPFNQNTGWYEEDCDCVIVYLAMPHLFPDFTVEKAMPMISGLADDDKWKAIEAFSRQLLTE